MEEPLNKNTIFYQTLRCCCCRTVENLLQINHNWENEEITKKVKYITSEQWEIMSTYICKKCKTNIDQTYNFKKLVLKSFEAFKTTTESAVGVEIEIKEEIEEIDTSHLDANTLASIMGVVKEENDVQIKLEVEELEEMLSGGENRIEINEIELEEVEEDVRQLEKESAEVKFSTYLQNNAVSECKHCKTTFPNHDVLNDHYTFEHDVDQFFKCNFCYLKFTSEQELKTHFSVHDLKESHSIYVCKVEKCNKLEFATKDELQAHYKWVHVQDVEYFECNKCCDKIFAKKTDLLRHLVKKRKPGILTHQTGEQNVEKTLVNAPVGPPELTPKPKPKTFKKSNVSVALKCEMCEKLLTNATHYDYHMKTVHKITKTLYTCTFCQQNFLYKDDLNNHSSVHDRAINGDTTGWFKCDHCLKRYVRKHSLKQHMKQHHGIDLLIT